MTGYGTNLEDKKVGDIFYRNIWKTFKVGDKVIVEKENFILDCLVVKRKGQERYKLKITSKVIK